MKGIKTGGREKGTVNLMTSELRATLKQIVSNELESISATLETLEPDKRCEMILKLLPYVLPKVESVKMEDGEPWKSDWGIQ